MHAPRITWRCCTVAFSLQPELDAIMTTTRLLTRFECLFAVNHRAECVNRSRVIIFRGIMCRLIQRFGSTQNQTKPNVFKIKLHI